MQDKRAGDPTRHRDQGRLVLVALSIFLLFGTLVIRFYKIQIVEGEKWAAKARAQHETVITEHARRGIFYSCPRERMGISEDPRPLVADVAKFHLFADPSSVPAKNREEVVQALSGFLGVKGEGQDKLRSNMSLNTRYRRIATWISRQQREEIMAWWRPYARKEKIVRNALFFEQDYQRSYPFGKMLGQVLHTVLEDREHGGRIATGGLEQMFHKELSGVDGKRRILRSPRHPLDAGELLSPPRDGADVYLTIDYHLQAIAEEEIEKAVRQAGARSGWAGVMDPHSGEVLALAQYPFFEPEKIQDYYRDPEKKADTCLKAVTEAYEPGSIFKPFIGTICMLASEDWAARGHARFFDPDGELNTASPQFIGRRTPLKDLRFHKAMNMAMAVQKSGNIYFARLVEHIVQKQGNEWFRNNLKDIFGFGSISGIELPSESAGFLPCPGKTYPSGALEWSGPTPYSLAIGHNILTNGIQIMSAYCVIANGGIKVQPTIVKEVVRIDGEGKKEILRKGKGGQGKRVLDEKIAKKMLTYMKYSTKQGGSGGRADVYGYTDAGKSGTSEKIVAGKYSKSDHTSSFVGIVPANDPKFVIVVVIDEPVKKYIPGRGKVHMGGQCAGPAFKEIAFRSLQHLGVPMDDPYGFPANDPRYDPKKADWATECKTLQELYNKWNGVKY